MTSTGRAREGRGPRPAHIAAALAALLSCAGSAHGPARSRVPLRLVLPAIDGGQIDLGSYRGRAVVLHAFTTWSMASQADIEQLLDARRAHPDRVEVIGLALDPDGYRLVDPWRRAMRIPYLLALATDAIRDGRSVLGRIKEVPTTVILGTDGALVERIEGPLAPGQLRELLADLIPRE